MDEVYFRLMEAANLMCIVGEFSASVHGGHNMTGMANLGAFGCMSYRVCATTMMSRPWALSLIGSIASSTIASSSDVGSMASSTIASSSEVSSNASFHSCSNR